VGKKRKTLDEARKEENCGKKRSSPRYCISQGEISLYSGKKKYKQNSPDDSGEGLKKEGASDCQVRHPVKPNLETGKRGISRRNRKPKKRIEMLKAVLLKRAPQQVE